MDVVEKFFTIASSLYSLCEKVKANKKDCQDLAQRVKNWEPHIVKIKGKGDGDISENVNIVLCDLISILEEAEKFVRKYSTDNLVKRLVKHNKHGEEFAGLNGQLDEVFQRLSTALHLETHDKIDELVRRDGKAKSSSKGPSKGPSKQKMADTVDSSTGNTDADKAHFVMEKRAKVIQDAAHVMALVDSLQDKNMIHPEFYAAIAAEKTDVIQMRKLYQKVIQPGGTKVRAAFYDAIKEHLPNLLEKLGDLK